MRKIVAQLFVSLDGVVESPEKWVAFDDEMGEAVNAGTGAADTLLLGRRTYEVFAASWPQRTVEDDPMAGWMNDTPKVVVSSTLESPAWNNTTVIDGDVEASLRALKAKPGKNILVNGSATLVQSLLRDGMLDELRLFVHPTLVGTGQRLFDDGGDHVALELIEARPLSTGVVFATYKPESS